MRLLLPLFLVWLAAAARGASLADEAALHGDVEVGVALEADQQSGNALGRVRIRASREVVWSLITSCPEALKLVPGLMDCKVVGTAPDQSWQIIRHVMDYSWYTPRLTYDLRAAYDKPRRVSVVRIAGDLKTLDGSWTLTSDGDFTVAHYAVHLSPGFWVPSWIVKVALKRDLPKMLRALRARAESVQDQRRG